MKKKRENYYKYTTVALAENEHLRIVRDASFVEWECLGFRDGERCSDLDGYYFKSEVKLKLRTVKQ